PIGGWGDHNHTFAGDGHPYQWASARSEPAPVRERTSISANLAGSSSEEVTLPSQPRKKPSGTETSAGFVSGKIAKATQEKMASSAPEVTGEKKIRTSAEISPPHMDHSEPRVLNRFQYSEYRIEGRLAEAATANASETRKATFRSLARIPPTMETAPMIKVAILPTRSTCPSVAVPRLSTEL